MMVFITILFFIVLAYGLGSIIRYLAPEAAGYEKHIMRIGLGVAIFTVLATAFTILHIPLDWKLFLIIALIPIIHELYQNKATLKEKLASIRFPLTKSNMYLLGVIAIFL